jgi:serpin B
MRRALLLSGILFLAILLLPSCSAIPINVQDTHSDAPRDLSPKVKDGDLAELVAGNNEFAFALYQKLFSGDENLFYSPYSISAALAMTYAGAKNRTADQMARALHFTLPQERLHPAFNKLALELASRAEAEGLKPGQAF